MTEPSGRSPDLAGHAGVTPDRQPPRLAALVVTHNRKPQLRRTVARLLAEDIDYLVIVDNASTDGSTDFLFDLEASDGRLHVIRLSENRGGAGGFETGLRDTMRLFDPDWCVVMDDDARPLPGAMAAFRTQAPDLAAAGWEALAAGVYYPDGEICEMNRPSRNPFWNLRSFARTLFGGGRAGFHVQDRDYDDQTAQKIDAASFVGLYLSRAAITRAGYPDGNLFIYGDDVLYTLKLTAAGGNIGFAPWLRFEHDCTTFRRGGGHIHRPMWKVYYNYRNGLLAYRQAAGPILFWPVLLVVLIKWTTKARAYEADWKTYLSLLATAVGDALRNRRDRSHREVRKLARHTDPDPTALAPGKD